MRCSPTTHIKASSSQSHSTEASTICAAQIAAENPTVIPMAATHSSASCGQPCSYWSHEIPTQACHSGLACHYFPLPNENHSINWVRPKIGTPKQLNSMVYHEFPNWSCCFVGTQFSDTPKSQMFGDVWSILDKPTMRQLCSSSAAGEPFTFWQLDSTLLTA